MVKKIAFIFPTIVIGGHEYQGIEFAKNASKTHAVSVVLNKPEHKVAFEQSSLNVIVSNISFFHTGNILLQTWHGIKCMLMIRRLLAEFDQTVVCAGTLEAGVSIGIALIGKPVDIYVPMFVDRSVLWKRWGTLYNCLTKNIVYLFNNIITINKVQAKLLARGKVPTILPNLISPVVSTHLASKRENRLFFVGRFDVQKNLIELLSWLDNPDTGYAELLLIGDGPLKDEIEKYSHKLNHIRVIFSGWINKIDQEEIIQSGDVLVLNSLYEGEPLIIREANERGNIVLARNIPGVRGCTYKKHRFSDASQLQKLLRMAKSSELKTYGKTNIINITRARKNAIESLFI